jgi:hypothetical protein
MPALPSDSPEQFKQLEPLGCGVVFGVLFFLLGLTFALWALAWFVLGLQVFQQAPMTVVFAGVIGLCVLLRVLAYGGDVFGRRGLIIDRTRESLAVLGGLFIPRVVATHCLRDFHRLCIRPVRVRTGRNSSRTDYHLDLVSPDRQSVSVAVQTTYTAARDLAEKVGVFLHWDVEDATAPTPLLLPGDTLGKGLAERSGGCGTAPLAEPPADMVGSVTRAGDRVVYRIPPRGGLGCLLSFLVVTALVASGVAAMLAANAEKAGVIAFGVVVLIFWCIGLWVLLTETERTSVEVDSRGVRVRRAKLLYATSKVYPLAALREVRQDHAWELRLIAAGDETTLGDSRLTEAELSWLRAAILHAAQTAGQS